MVATNAAVSPCGVEPRTTDQVVDVGPEQSRPEEWPREDRRRSPAARALHSAGRLLSWVGRCLLWVVGITWLASVAFQSAACVVFALFMSVRALLGLIA
jgi:hypothetical protein